MIESPTTTFTDEEHAKELLTELSEDGHDLDEMKAFIETHGNKDFVKCLRTYTLVGSMMNQEWSSQVIFR